MNVLGYTQIELIPFGITVVLLSITGRVGNQKACAGYKIKATPVGIS